MNIKEALYTRRSIRAYSDKPVDKYAIEQIIDAAMQAPCGMGAQPWAFAVITDAAMLKNLSDKSKAFLLANLDTYPTFEQFREEFENPDFHLLYNAPALVVVCAKPNISPTPEIDCVLAAENLMLAARGIGLGTCWMGLVHMYLGTPEGKKEFNIPEGLTIIAPIAVGYPVGEFSEMDKGSPDILFWK